jgi:hypothetical protein
VSLCPSTSEGGQGNLFLSSIARRIIAVAMASLLAGTFLVSVWASVAQLPIGNILDVGNPLLRIFPANRGEDAADVASTDATALETSGYRMDEAQDTGDEAEAVDAAFVHRAECPGPVPLRDWSRDTFTKVLLEC